MGSPLLSPQGIDIAGNPAILAGMVAMSFRYIFNGSETAPTLNAVVGVVGDKTTS